MLAGESERGDDGERHEPGPDQVCEAEPVGESLWHGDVAADGIARGLSCQSSEEGKSHPSAYLAGGVDQARRQPGLPCPRSSPASTFRASTFSG